jgi:hypothetical protein
MNVYKLKPMRFLSNTSHKNEMNNNRKYDKYVLGFSEI